MISENSFLELLLSFLLLFPSRFKMRSNLFMKKEDEVMRKKKMTFAEGIRAQFSTKSLVLIPIAVGINLIGGCSALKLPLFLDMIGTIVVACLSGIWVSALCGCWPMYSWHWWQILFICPIPSSVFCVRQSPDIWWKKVFSRMFGELFWHGLHVRWPTPFPPQWSQFSFRRVSRRDRNFSTDRNADRSYEKHYNFGITTSMLENLIDKGITFFIAFILIQKIPKRFLSQYAADTDDEEDDED